MRTVKITTAIASLALAVSLAAITGPAHADPPVQDDQAVTLAEEAPDPADADPGTIPPSGEWTLLAANDAVIKSNSASGRTMTICHNWTTTGSHCASGVGSLSPGQNSKTKYGWKDTDGILNVPNGWCLYNLSNNIVKYGSSSDSANDFKVSGFYGATFTYRLGAC